MRARRQAIRGDAEPATSGRAFDVVKRVFDLTTAFLGLILVSPLLAAVAIAIRVTMGSPVLWRQERSGKHGRPFTLVKFRTMRAPLPGEESPRSDEARLMPLGRTLRASSLDELPSLWNVVAGHVSFVGPRPLPTQYLPRYSSDQARRLDVLPGLTGWAQINGRNNQTWDERFELDLWYVRHRGCRVDLAILLRTPKSVLTRRGIARPGYATMPEFTGSGDAQEASRGE